MPSGKADVEIAALFAKREVARTVDREREDGRVIGEDRRGAVALMDVTIDHHGTSHGVLGLERAQRDDRVVEHAVALAMVREGVVASRPPG